MLKTISCLLIFTLSMAGFAVLGDQMELNNPSFEQGTGGYWINTPSATSIDADTSSQGKQSLCLQSPVSVVQFVALRPGEVYRFSFDSKGELDKDGPKIQLALMLQGNKPIMFWLPENRDKNDFEFIPTGKWNRKEFVFGPVPPQAQGQEVTQIGLYINAVAGVKPGKVWIDNLQVSSEKAAPENDGAKKKRPSLDPLTLELPGSIQIFEQPMLVKLAAPGAPDKATITLEITDFRGHQVLTRNGPSTAGLQAELSSPGYYRLNASLITQSGQILQKRTTSLLVTTPLPTDYYSTPEPAFGVWGGLTDEMLRIGGAKWTRQLFWPQFQPKDFAGTPPSPEKLKARTPVKVIKCLNVLDAFKKMVPIPKEDWPTLLDKKIGKELVASRGLVDVWETQNEPMVGENFHGSMEDVMDIISNESRLVRELSPGTPLAGICINPMSANQYNQITGYYKRLGIAKLIDAVMLHPYIPNAASPDTSGYVDILNRLERDLHTITGKDVPLYISEIGYSTQPGGEVTELQQAAYLARVVLLNRQVKSLRACVWHIGLWNEATSPRELDYGILRGHQKGSQIREPKPAFAAWATVSRQTYNAEYIGELEFGRGVRVLLFSRKSCPLIVAYSLSKSSKTLKIPLGGGKVTVTDLCGTAVEMPTLSGVAQLEVDESPTYISGSDPGDVQRLGRIKVIFSPEDLKAKPGQDAHLSMRGTPLSLEGSEIKVETPPGWKVSLSGSGESRSITLAVPSNALPGEQTLFIHLIKDGESKFIWRREMQILPPVELTDMKIISGTDGSSNLSFLPVGAGLNEIRVDLLEDDKSFASGNIEVGRVAAIKIPSISFGRTHIYSADVDAGNGCKWKAPLVNLNQFPIMKAKSGSTMVNQTGFDLAGGEYSKGSIDGGFDQPEGRIRLSWNESFFLLRVETHDRWHVVKESPESMFGADSLQIGVSVGQDEMIHPNNDGIQETAYSEFGVMPSGGGECASHVWASSNRNLSELSKPLPDLKARWSRAADTTVYELEIPWKSLNVKNPRPGMHLKFSLLVNDADESKQRHWLEWYSGIGNGKDPSLYGEGILADTSGAK